MQKNQVFLSGEVSDIERMIKRYVKRQIVAGILLSNDTVHMHLDGGFADHGLIDAGDSALSGTDTNINGGTA